MPSVIPVRASNSNKAAVLRDPAHNRIFRVTQTACQNFVSWLTVEIVCNSEEQLEHYVQLGEANGTAITCDNLVSFLERNA